jgi:hypothetical protein
LFSKERSAGNEVEPAERVSGATGDSNPTVVGAIVVVEVVVGAIVVVVDVVVKVELELGANVVGDAKANSTGFGCDRGKGSDRTEEIWIRPELLKCIGSTNPSGAVTAPPISRVSGSPLAVFAVTE